MLPAPLKTASLREHSQQLPLHSSSSSATVPSSSTKDNLRSQLRLSATIDPLLVPQAHSSRHFYSQALLSDQKHALQPDYRTSFRSANDVVRRLLPYHVWHVNSADIEHVLALDHHSCNKEGLEPFPTSEEAFQLFAKYSKLARRAQRLRIELEGADNATNAALHGKETLYNLEKLSTENEKRLLVEEQDNLRRAKEEAIHAGVSWESLMRMSASFGQTYSQSQEASLLDSITNPTTGSSSTSGNGPFQYQYAAMSSYPTTPRPPPSTFSSIITSAANTPRPPAVKGARPRGRPRKSFGMVQSMVPHVATPQTGSLPSKAASAAANPRPSQGSAASLPRPRQSSSPSTMSNSQSSIKAAPSSTASTASIPSHPIPLVLPLSTLAQLSALGIAPIPAPHLRPAISARLAQTANASTAAVPSGSATTSSSTQASIPLPVNIHSTAPRPAPLHQHEPALLMGITEAPLAPTRHVSEGNASQTSTPTTKGNATSQQMLHISVVLSKLTPSQLSGLATLMQGLQSNANQTRAANSSSINDTPHSTTSDNQGPG